MTKAMWAAVTVGALMVVCAVVIALIGPKDSTGVQGVLTSLGTLFLLIVGVIRTGNVQANVDAVHERLDQTDTPPAP